MNRDPSAKAAGQPELPQRRWKVDLDEVPAELRDNWFIRGCMADTPEDEALFAELAEFDRLDP